MRTHANSPHTRYGTVRESTQYSTAPRSALGPFFLCTPTCAHALTRGWPNLGSAWRLVGGDRAAQPISQRDSARRTTRAHQPPTPRHHSTSAFGTSAFSIQHSMATVFDPTLRPKAVCTVRRGSRMSSRQGVSCECSVASLVRTGVDGTVYGTVR